jgi:AcrR family transcriptional regulator
MGEPHSALDAPRAQVGAAPSLEELRELPRADELQASSRRGRGRRPADEVRRAVLLAAGRLLLAEGMRTFTIERVAALAGSSKMTLYKWWPSKGALALDGYFTTVEGVLTFPDTGDIEADLRTQLRSFVGLVRDTPAGRVIAELIGEAQTDPALAAAFRERYSGPRRALAVAALERAKTRGELRADVDPEVVVDQLWGACYHRLLLPDQPLTDDFAAALVDNLFHGLR